MQHRCLLGELDPDKTLYDTFTTNMRTSSGQSCLEVPKHNKIMWDKNCRINLNLIIGLNDPIFLPLNTMGVLRLNPVGAGTRLEIAI